MNEERIPAVRDWEHLQCSLWSLIEWRCLPAHSDTTTTGLPWSQGQFVSELKAIHGHSSLSNYLFPTMERLLAGTTGLRLGPQGAKRSCSATYLRSSLVAIAECNSTHQEMWFLLWAMPKLPWFQCSKPVAPISQAISTSADHAGQPVCTSGDWWKS